MTTLLDMYGRPLNAGKVGIPAGKPLAPRITLSEPKPAINRPAPAKRVTLALTDVIHVHMAECPNRPDTQSYTLYHCYRDGMTVADFIAEANAYGITTAKARAHLAWDIKRDRISLNG